VASTEDRSKVFLEQKDYEKTVEKTSKYLLTRPPMNSLRPLMEGKKNRYKLTVPPSLRRKKNNEKKPGHS